VRDKGETASSVRQILEPLAMDNYIDVNRQVHNAIDEESALKIGVTT